MPFTLRSHGQILGETDFELRTAATKRAGAFRPTAVGATLLPTLTGIGPALFALGERWEREGVTVNDTERAMAMFEESDAMRFARQLDALQLELRDPDGRVIPTRSVAVHDLELSLAGEERTPNPHGPRYIISATLAIRRRKKAVAAITQ